MLQGDQRPDQLAQRIAGASRHQLQSFAQKTADLFRLESEIEHSERGIKVFVEILRNSVFLHPEVDVAAMKLNVRFYHPMMAIMPLTLKEERMGPRAPARFGIEMAFRAANRLIHERDAAG